MPVVLVLILLCSHSFASCVGRMVNPITDICWKCLFPISIGGNTVQIGGGEDIPNPKNIVHFCPFGEGKKMGPCLPIGFWEPIRLIDVTRTPYCLVNLGGMMVWTPMISDIYLSTVLWSVVLQ